MDPKSRAMVLAAACAAVTLAAAVAFMLVGRGIPRPLPGLAPEQIAAVRATPEPAAPPPLSPGEELVNPAEFEDGPGS